MFLFNIFIAGDRQGNFLNASGQLSELARINIKAAKSLFPDLDYRLFDYERIRRLLRDRFPEAVLDAFDGLSPYSYKADLAKYCILFYHGGVYFDLSYHMLVRFSNGGPRPVVFRDHMHSAPWDTSTGLIYMPPGEKSMILAIRKVCANVRKKYYGPNCLCPTGPVLFGRMLAKGCGPEQLIAGYAVWEKGRRLLNRNDPRINELSRVVDLTALKSVHCQVLGRDLIAIKTKRGGVGVGDLFEGGNSYSRLWRDRLVYDS